MIKSKSLPLKWQQWKIGRIIYSGKRMVLLILPRSRDHVMKFFFQLSLYHRCDHLKLYKFIKVICDDDLGTLRKHPFISRAMVLKAWSMISKEYSVLSGDIAYQTSLKLYKDIAREEGKLLLVISCLGVLTRRYSESCIRKLVDLGYNYKFDSNIPESYQNDIEKVSKNIRMVKIELARKRIEFDKYRSGERRTKKEDFVLSLLKLSKFMGYRINEKVVTVAEYILMSRQYREHVESLIKDGTKKVKKGITGGKY